MMSLGQQQKLVQELRREFGPGILENTPFPEPYCADKSRVKAIYLGCDPSNKYCRDLEYVFALPKGNPPMFRRMVSLIGENLRRVGLRWDSVYAQNLCRNYFALETAKNVHLWKAVAGRWIPILRDELGQFKSDIPVLLSAEVLYSVLLKSRSQPRTPKEFYSCSQGAPIPVPADENQLSRPLIPFYRHWYYDLKRQEWRRYRAAVADCLPEVTRGS